MIAWPTMVGGTAVGTYLIVTNQDAIATYCGFGFAATLMLSAISIAAGILVHISVAAEGWHPRLRMNVRAPPVHACALACTLCAQRASVHACVHLHSQIGTMPTCSSKALRHRVIPVTGV